MSRIRSTPRGEALTVYADNAIAWSGPVGSDIAGIDGPVGFRTDNAHVELEFFAAMSGVQSAGASSRGHCEPAPGGD